MSDVSAGLARLTSHYLRQSVEYRRCCHSLARALQAVSRTSLPPPVADQVARALADYKIAVKRAENSAA